MRGPSLSQPMAAAPLKGPHSANRPPPLEPGQPLLGVGLMLLRSLQVFSGEILKGGVVHPFWSGTGGGQARAGLLRTPLRPGYPVLPLALIG